MKKRLLAIFIVIVMLLSHTTIFADMDLSTSTASNDDTAYLDEETNEIVVLRENEDLREANIKHFDLSDGTSKALVYSQAVHYLDENGKWVDIDNSLTLNGNEYSVNNKSKIKFANKSGSNGLLSIKDGDYKIDLTPLDTNKVSVEIENPQENNSRKFDDVKKLSNLVSKAIYKNIYDGIDLEYILTGNNVKENIIVNSKQDSYVYTFELKLNKLNAELVDNSIALYDSDTGEKMYVIPAPYMYDSAGEVSQEVEYTLTKNSKWKYTLTVEASKEWINSEERNFPVTIDPTIIADTDVIDNFFTIDNDANANLQYLMIGNFMNYYIDMLAFIKFDNIETTIPVGCMVVNAKAVAFISYLDKPSNVDFRIGVYEATADWTNSISWENRNSYYNSNNVIDSVEITSTGIHEWDITELYEKWQTQNNGFCLKAVNLPSNVMARAHITTVESVDSPIPQLELTYVNHIGVEDYYGYAYNTLGSYGESYVNLYNGSLTYINHLTTISNGNLSYDINMVYNSIEQAWKPSFNENIARYNDGIERYIWTDADGTKHWFTPYMEKNYWGQYLCYNVSADGTKTQTTTPTEFYPEDDIDYVLTKTTNNELILKDYQGNQKLFDENGRLSRICDAQGNVLHFSYVSERLSLIDYRTYDNEFTTQMRLTYYESGDLRTIYNFATQLEISFKWSSNKITEITYNYKDSPTHKEIDLMYYSDSGILGRVIDSTDRIYIEYAKDENNKITRIQEYMQVNGSYSKQNQNNINYATDSTIYVDLAEDLTLNTSDDIRTKYVFDTKGRKATLSVGDGVGSEFTLMNTYSYNDEILPDDVYYTISYSNNINNELYVDESEANIVRYDIDVGEEEFLKFSNLPTTSTTDNVTSNAEENCIDNTNEIVSPAHIIGDDNRTPVQDVEQYPYSAICYLHLYFENGEYRGTGFLVGPNLLLTAAHVLRDGETGNPTFVQRIDVYPGAVTNENQNAPTSSFETVGIESVYIQKKYYDLEKSNIGEKSNYDWGLCVLDSNIGYQTGWLNIGITSSNINNLEINVVGYHGDMSYDMYKSEGNVKETTEHIIIHLADQADGSSGSPLFLKNDSFYTVQGIHIAQIRKVNSEENANKALKINSFIYTFVTSLKISE